MHLHNNNGRGDGPLAKRLGVRHSPTIPAMMCLAGVLFGSCSLFDQADTEGKVMASSSATQVIILNSTHETIYYAIIPADVLAAMLWAPCKDPIHCRKIRPRESTVVGFDEFMNGREDDEVAVYWWHLVRKLDGSYEPDEINSIFVKL